MQCLNSNKLEHLYHEKVLHSTSSSMLDLLPILVLRQFSKNKQTPKQIDDTPDEFNQGIWGPII